MESLIADKINIIKNNDNSFKVIAIKDGETIQIDRANIKVFVEALVANDKTISKFTIRD